MSTRGTRGKTTTGGRTTSSNDAGNDAASTAASEDYRFNATAKAAAPAAAPATSLASATIPLDPSAGRKASTDLVTQQQLALLATQFLSTARNFTDVDIDISQDADMLALAKSRFDSGLALIGLLEPHVSGNRECKTKFGELEVACFKIASKCGPQPWAQRYVTSYRSGASSTAIAAATAAAASAAAAVSDVSSPIMTLASAAAASASAPPATATATARSLANSALPMLSSQVYHGGLQTGGLSANSVLGNNLNAVPTSMPQSERYVVLGRNQKPREKKPNEVSIPGRGRKKVSPLEMSGKSSSVLSSAMYSIQTHAKNGGKISVMLSEAYRRRNEERRNKRKRKFGEVDAAVTKSLGSSGAGAAGLAKDGDDDDSEDDEARANFYQQATGAGHARSRAPASSPQELQQLEAEMMQSFDNTLQAVRRFREARGDFLVPDDKANYFAAFAAPDGRFYGEQGNVQKGEYELLMQFFEALHSKPAEQWCRYSATKTKYNTFKCPLESFGVAADGDDDAHGGMIDEHGASGVGFHDYHAQAHHGQAQHHLGGILASQNPSDAFNI